MPNRLVEGVCHIPFASGRSIIWKRVTLWRFLSFFFNRRASCSSTTVNASRLRLNARHSVAPSSMAIISLHRPSAGGACNATREWTTRYFDSISWSSHVPAFSIYSHPSHGKSRLNQASVHGPTCRLGHAVSFLYSILNSDSNLLSTTSSCTIFLTNLQCEKRLVGLPQFRERHHIFKSVTSLITTNPILSVSIVSHPPLPCQR